MPTIRIHLHLVAVQSVQWMKLSRRVASRWLVNSAELFAHTVYKKPAISSLKETKHPSCCWISRFKLFHISFFCEWSVNEASLFKVWRKLFDVRWILNDVPWLFPRCSIYAWERNFEEGNKYSLKMIQQSIFDWLIIWVLRFTGCLQWMRPGIFV